MTSSTEIIPDSAPHVFQVALFTPAPKAGKRAPANWNRDENATRHIGAPWRRQGSSCLLAVPSAILPEELNFVLNPEHPDAQRLQLVRERPFTLDPRPI